VSRHAALPQVSLSSTVVVAVDVGKRSFAVSVSAADRQRLLGPVDCAMTRPALDRLVEQVPGGPKLHRPEQATPPAPLPALGEQP
jgi:hypothetical protein